MNDNKVDLSLLKEEYFYLEAEIERFDAKSLTIKAWSVSLAATIAGSSAFTNNKLVIIFATLISLMFWFIDGFWKSFQQANYSRLDEIEGFMRGETKEIANLQILKSWTHEYHKGGNKGILRRLLKIMFWPHILLPHGAMFVLLLIIYYTIS